MSLFTKKPEIVKIIKAPKKEAAPFVPYEKTHRLEKLGFVIVIVNENQASAIVDILDNAGCSASFICRGKGTASNDVYEVLGIANNTKHVVMAPLKLSSWPLAKKGLEERFAVSNYAKGLAVLVELDSVCGVSTYKFLTDSRGLDNEKGAAKMENIEKKDNYEVVTVIVNDGFTDLVMDAAKKAGARGGTILTARGTGNKDIEKFFGVVITPEKQIVMILVPREIKDAVVEGIYKEVGINTKGQGIAFSFPASDVIGIVESKPEDKQVEEGNIPPEK
jgi:nitrogen regulatory protein PII